jgi:hypothetical protein
MRRDCIRLLSQKLPYIATLKNHENIGEIGEFFSGAYHTFGDSDDTVVAVRAALLSTPKVKQDLLRFVERFCGSMDDDCAKLLKALYPSHTCATVDEIKLFAAEQRTAPIVGVNKR